MRFPVAALIFAVLCFIMFCGWAWTSLLLGTVKDAMTPLADQLTAASKTAYLNQLTMINNALGVVCVLCFIMIFVMFAFDSWRSEPEYFYRRY